MAWLQAIRLPLRPGYLIKHMLRTWVVGFYIRMLKIIASVGHAEALHVLDNPSYFAPELFSRSLILRSSSSRLRF